MKGKLLFAAGLATGYVVGTRAGRSAYTTLTQKVRAAGASDSVQSLIGKARSVAEERVPKLTASVSSVADTTASVAQAAADASGPESASDEAAESSQPKRSTGAKRSGGSRSAAETGVETAEEAAQVFEEQLPESGGAIDDAGSTLPADPGGAADESRNPTATS